VNGVIYCRVSSKEQVDGTSLESQEIACREYATRNHIDVAKVFVERGESAKFADRTQLLELLSFCGDRSKSIDCLLVWKVDRLARNVGDHFSIKASLLKQQIRVISATEPIDANPEGKLLETILAGFAQFDNDLRAARTVQGMKRKLQEGLYPWKAPLGYRSVTLGSKKTEPDQPIQPSFGILQRGWNEFSTGQHSKADVLRRMTARGLLTRGGKPLAKQSLDHIFRDSFYAGILHDPWSSDEYSGRHLPMISRATFLAVQQILGRSRLAVPHKSVRTEFPLRTFARCPNCKNHFTGSFSRGRSKRYPYYRCFNRACEPHTSYPLKQVHGEFLSFLNEAAPEARALDRLKGRLAERAGTWSETSRAMTERREVDVKRIHEQEQQLIRMKMDRLITDDEFIAQRSSLTARLSQIEVHDAVQTIDGDAIVKNMDLICAPLMDLAFTWQSMPVEFQRRFQLMALPRGYVFGSIGTAPMGRLFSAFVHSDTAKSNLVPHDSQSWNLLVKDIEQIADLFRQLTI
jgi:DNA invertase Pin-like site-specific DNA recombinase